MRLIDADKITFFNCLAKTGSAVCCHAEGIVSKSAIEMQPTVKAISIEWLESQLNVFGDGFYNLRLVIKQWEKENERMDNR